MFTEFIDFLLGRPTPSQKLLKTQMALLASKYSDTPLHMDTLNYAVYNPEINHLHVQKVIDCEEYKLMPICEKIEVLREHFPNKIAEAERRAILKQTKTRSDL